MQSELKAKEINFVEALSIKDKKATKKVIDFRRIFTYVFPIGLTLVMIVIIVFLIGATQIMKNNVADIEWQISQAEASQTALDASSGKLEDYQIYKDNYEAIVDEDTTEINKDIVNTVINAAGDCNIKNFDYSEGSIVLVVDSLTNDQPAKMAQRLRDTDKFSSVSYQGLTSTGEGYEFSIAAELK